VLCHIGAEETIEPFNENCVRKHRRPQDFDVEYPTDYPDAKLAGKKYHYEADVTGIKIRHCRS